MKILVGIVVLALLGVGGFTWLMLHVTYSQGDRAGYVQKLSKKGWVCKTWEGELAMVTIPGTVAEKFYFTVPSDGIAAKINSSLGKRVALHYQQHRWIPTACFGETEYFITDLRIVE